MSKPKEPLKTQAEINQEYSSVCQQMGHRFFDTLGYAINGYKAISKLSDLLAQRIALDNLTAKKTEDNNEDVRKEFDKQSNENIEYTTKVVSGYIIPEGGTP